MKKKKIFFPKPRFNAAKITLWVALVVMAVIVGIAALNSGGV